MEHVKEVLYLAGAALVLIIFILKVGACTERDDKRKHEIKMKKLELCEKGILAPEVCVNE